MNTSIQPLLDIVDESKSFNHKQILQRKYLDENNKRKRKWDHNI